MMSTETRKDLAVCSSLLDQAWCDLRDWTDEIGCAETQRLLRLLQQRDDGESLLQEMILVDGFADVVKDLAYAALMETLVRRGRCIVEEELEDEELEDEELRIIEDSRLPGGPFTGLEQ